MIYKVWQALVFSFQELVVNALAFSREVTICLVAYQNNQSIKSEKRHDKAIEDLQRAQIERPKKRQERLDYINNQIMKEHKAEKRFMDLNSAM